MSYTGTMKDWVAKTLLPYFAQAVPIIARAHFSGPGRS
jgi:hypothetical protein